MPIRLNLLAEEQALEEQRRRDPVRRALVLAVVVVIAALGVSAILWSKQMIRNVEVAHLQSNLDAHTNEFNRVLQNRKELAAARARLAALVQLATNRFLTGNLLNALQEANVPEVQLTQLRTDHSYTTTPATPPTTSGGRAIPGKPATTTEKIILTIGAKDFSNPPGDAVLKFKDDLSRLIYFQNAMGKTNEIHLKDRSAPQLGADGRPFVQFTLECDYPLKKR